MLPTSILSLLASAGVASALGPWPPHGGPGSWSPHGGPGSVGFPGDRPTPTASACAPANATASATPSGAAAWVADQFRSLVVFGDSYTDESRLGYFINHKGAAPPGMSQSKHLDIPPLPILTT